MPPKNYRINDRDYTFPPFENQAKIFRKKLFKQKLLDFELNKKNK